MSRRAFLLALAALASLDGRCRTYTYRTNAVYRIEAGADWLPFFNDREIIAGSALDLTQLGCLDAPAGKHGWLKAVGDHFEFEDSPGVRRRFFGANICGEAPYPESPKAAADLADRMARLGYNAIRVHHYDNAISRVRDGRLELVPEMIDRLDRFLAECFKRGIYVTTDLYVSRRTPARDIGVDREGFVRKHHMMTTDWGFRNWCEFARMFLLHRNPYTGRAYAEEPGMPFIALINEASFHGSDANTLLETGELDAKWRQWLREERRRNPACHPGYEVDKVPREGMAWWPERPQSPMMSAFYAWVEKDFDLRARAFLRGELGVKALLTGQNNGPVNAIIHRLRTETCDYVDVHHYVDHPASFSSPLLIKNVNEALESFTGYAKLAWDRDWGFPYTVSEYDYCTPNTSRAMNGPMIGAMAAQQGWSALWRYDYAGERLTFSRSLQVPWLFNAITDPMQLASDRATAFLFLRGDMGPLETRLAIDYDERALDNAQTRTWGCPRDGGAIAWKTRVGTTVCGGRGAGIPSFAAVDYPTNRAPVFSAARTDASPVVCDPVRGLFSFATPCCSGGYALRGLIDAGTLKAELALAPAVVWAGALDGMPLVRSRRILLSHLTDVQAEGTEFADPTLTLMLNRGPRKRSLMRRGYAKVTIARDAPGACRVWALDTAGRRVEEVPCKVLKQGLEIVLDTLGDTCTRMLYEVVSP